MNRFVPFRVHLLRPAFILMSTLTKTLKTPSKAVRNKMIPFRMCIVRHGETPENKNNIYQGQIDTILSEEGVRQTELAGARLQDERFTHAFSSDLKRAYNTAENILKRNKHADNLVLVKDQRIREKSFGVLEGKTKQYVEEVVRKHNSTPSEFVAEGAESWPQVMERLVSFFDSLCNKIHTEATRKKSTSNMENESSPNDENASESNESTPYVLMVSHGGAIRQLLFYISRNIATEFDRTSRKNVGKLCPNTGVSNLEVYVGTESGKAEFVKCTMLYDGSHLVVEEKILYEDHAL